MQTILNPAWYQGHQRRSPYFEGWYFKLVDRTQAHRYAIIPAVFLTEGREGPHAFIQVFDGVNGEMTYIPYPLSEFWAAEDRFEVHIGPNVFTTTAMQLDIRHPDLTLQGAVNFHDPRPWPVTVFSPGIMGWFAWIPLMECYHGVLSLDHALSGTFAINGQTVDFAGGRGYIEKDRGKSFPSGWVWMQTNHFDTPGTSLTGSIAMIPSIITMRPALEALFAAAGRRLADYLTLLPVDPLTRYFYPDGTVIDAAQNLPRMLDQIVALEPRDVEGYLAFLAHAAELHRITGDIFIYGEPPTLRDFLRVPLRDIIRVDAWRTMAQAHAHYVRSPHLRQLLGRFATYVGASPYRASAVLNVIAHVELNQGVWYPQGGIYQIARAYRRLAEELGVEIRTESRVTRIEVQNSTVCGVTLSSGERLPTRAVIANVDVTTVYHDLLPPDVAPARRKRLTNLAPSGSGFVLLLGIVGQHPELAQHNIFFTRNYRREFDDLFARGVPPQEATIYITATCKVDPQHAPPGCENWFVMVNAPPLGPGFDWATQGQAYRDTLLACLAAHGYDVRACIRSERWRTPADLRTQTGAWRGALYGLSSNNPLNALRRPHNRCPDVRGLYFAGGTTHPGGGAPMVTLSGGVAARMVLNSNHK